MNILNVLSTLFVQDSTSVKKINAVLTQNIPLPLSTKYWHDMLNVWFVKITGFGIRVIIAIIVFLIARLIFSSIVRAFEKMISKRHFDGIAISLLDSLMVAAMYVALFVLMALIIGIKSVSFAAILASMGLAIGMALSGQLQNLAGGVIILFTKPFKIGDYIVAHGVEGTVVAVTLFHTQITTPDNKMIFIPNGMLSSGVVTNNSHLETRRCQWIIGVEYNEDFDRASAVIKEILRKDKRILSSPEPTVVLHQLNASSVDIMIRAWVKSADLWPVYWDFNRMVYQEFNKVGIGFPFPQLTIHSAQTLSK